MSGPSASVEAAQSNLANQQLGIAEQQNNQSQAAYQKMQTEEAPAIGLYTALTQGSPTAAMTASAPLIAPITQGYNASQESIFNSTAPGAGRDYALSQLNVQKNANISNVFSNTTASAFDKLANIGAGQGSFSLASVGASLSGLTGSATTQNQLGQEQAASKAATMGFLGDIVSGASGVASAGITKCWIAEAIYGKHDVRTHIVRQYLNGPFSETAIGSMVMDLYLVFGERIAAVARRSSLLRGLLKPLFDRALRQALLDS